MAKPADDSEKEVLEQFRESVQNAVPPKQLKNDVYLLRWIRGKLRNAFPKRSATRDRNLEKALLMFNTSMEWRKTNDIDSIPFEKIPPEFNEFFYCHFGGFDKCGRPVICVPFGDWDIRPMLDNGKRDGLVRFLTQALEILDLTMQEMWRNQFPSRTKWQHTQFSVVFDLKGFTYAKLMHKKSIDTLLEVIKLYEANYPETLGSAIVINAPWVFSTLYAMIKPLLSEHTVSKISIYDSKEENWKKAVSAVVDEDQIPPRYGGTHIGTNIW